MNRAARPGGPAADQARLQPDETEIDEWLADAEFDEETDRLRRLGGDEELLLNLQLGGYSDAVWDPVAQELARYGHAVIRSWIRRRIIFHKVKRKTNYGLPTIDNWPNDDASEDLATDTVVAALDYFKNKVLISNKWDPARGASVRTFFVGQCLFQFSNRYMAYYKAELDRRATELLVGDDGDLDFLSGPLRGIEETVVAQSEAAEALGKVSKSRAKTAFLMHSRGYSHREIADAIGVADEKAVENMLVYQRSRIRRTS